ncbi:MAG: tRNA lysidine(34) synthetase TilS [Firmicutes bacterium]|nr:tRNA lysidine(34) synthetase TilS [Bacillota bacterium]
MNAELQVRKTVKEHNMIAAGDTVVLGLSGGPDSLCLLHILADLRRSLDFRLTALHVNHMMRGEQANEDASWLSEHCRELKVPLSVEICNVYRMAEEQGISPEEAGRKARHSALRRQKAMFETPCGRQGSGRVRIALAHNRDDQAETVLMRMLRGTGIHGIAGMEYVREDGLIRPLLDTPRSEIEAYCEKLGLQPRWDSTNADTYYTRNKLRLEVLPLLEKEFNPNLKETLARLANSAREDDSLLERLAQQAAEGYKGSFPVRELAAMDGALAKRVVRILFVREGLTEDIASAHLESLLEAVRGRRTGKVIEFPHGYRAEITRDEVLFGSV